MGGGLSGTGLLDLVRLTKKWGKLLRMAQNTSVDKLGG
jgi:hypothetical protein